MPSVISKFMDKGEKAFVQNQSVLSSVVIGAVLAAYGYKVAYPLIGNLISKPNKETTSLNNNLVKPSGLNGVKTSNGMAQTHGDPKTKSAMSKRNRFVTNIPNFNLAFILQFIKLVSMWLVLCRVSSKHMIKSVPIFNPKMTV